MSSSGGSGKCQDMGVHLTAAATRTKYSVLSFLETKDDRLEQPLDLSRKVERRVDGKNVPGEPMEYERENILTFVNENHNNKILNNNNYNDDSHYGNRAHIKKVYSFLQFLLTHSSKLYKQSPQMMSPVMDCFRGFDEVMRSRSESSFQGHPNNLELLNSAWRFLFQQTGQLQFVEQCTSLPTFLFPMIQESRRYFQDISSRQIYKYNQADSIEKIQNPSAIMTDRENMSRLSDSPQCSSNKKRRRTKVTDSRLMKRVATESTFNLYLDETVLENCLENRCSITSQSSISDDVSNDPKKYTLTPIHLRKAKLMFLYTRYPNSQMLKNFFPDIIFYKQNTAQLVKWFSNFREFYYSEMEKAVQRSISGGIKHSSELFVTEDCELFKNLMTHFNKNKQIEVPKEFIITVQITLREFFEAFSVGKNLHQSWKKPIYKNIAKLDQPLPEFFKDFNWMLELAKEDSGSNHLS